MTLPEKFHFFEVKNAMTDSRQILLIKNKVFQRKLNGTTAEIFVEDDIRIFGKGVMEYGVLSEYTRRFPEIVADLKKLEIPKGTKFVGELVVIDPKTGFENLGLVMTRSQRSVATNGSVKFYPAFLVILDVVEVAGIDVRESNYFYRINVLKNKVDWTKTDKIYFIENSVELDWDFIEKNKLEGVIIRDVDAKYGKGIWKLKREVTEDVYCKGEYNPSDSMAEFASLICYQLDKGGKEVYVADVGGGFSDDERKEMQKLLDSGSMKEYPLVLEIKTNGRTDSLKLISPIFMRMRLDKPCVQCIIN